MHPFFEPLDDRDTMLLLTTLTMGSSADVAVFERLPDAARDRLKAKAQALLAIPTEKRVPFMVHEIKQALAFKGLRGAERCDPSWLLHGLKGESPRVVAAILVTLPTPTVRALLEKLPPGIRQRLPPKEEMKRVPLELVRSVRQMFESRFSAMPKPSARGFGYRDIIQLERTEIFRLIRELGLVELGQAFVSVGKMALAELCRRLPRDKAEELIMAVRAASRVDLPELKSAQRFLSRVVVNFTDTEEFFQKAGLWRLAKASTLEDPGFRAAFRQRLPREAGLVFESYLDKATETGEAGEDALKRLQDSILVRVRYLAHKSAISARWGEVEMSYHDPTAAAAAEAAVAQPPAAGSGENPAGTSGMHGGGRPPAGPGPT
jgi:hypothetical protein